MLPIYLLPYLPIHPDFCPLPFFLQRAVPSVEAARVGRLSACCRSEVMLVLFDSPAGHCLFKVTDSGLLKKPEDIWDAFTSAAAAKKACAACAHARVGAVVSAEATLLTFGACAATG